MRRVVRRSNKVMTINEIRFWIKVVVTGKGNLGKEGGQWMIAFGGASAKVEAHLYVPANMRAIVSGGTSIREEEGEAYRKERIY